MTARWSIVSTMHGVPETVLPCIAHHLQTDAEFIFVYLDHPNPVLEGALARHPRCVVRVCDDNYWSKRPKGRPPILKKRQVINLRHALRNSNSDWLVHIDSDEFLVATDPRSVFSLSAELAKVPKSHDWARISPAERVLPPGQDQTSIFDGVFRMPGDQSVIKSAYGEWSRFLANGMTGHRKGKIAIRRQTKLLPRIHELHWPIKGEDSRDQPVQSSELPPFTKIVETKLLHFEGWTALQWAAKLLRFVDDNKLNYHHAGRRAAIEFMAQNSEPAKRRQLFERVQRLTPHAFEVLKRHDLLRAAPFDPSICAVELFPEIDFDFSVQAFDSRLRAANPDFYVRTGM